MEQETTTTSDDALKLIVGTIVVLIVAPIVASVILNAVNAGIQLYNDKVHQGKKQYAVMQKNADGTETEIDRVWM